MNGNIINKSINEDVQLLKLKLETIFPNVILNVKNESIVVDLKNKIYIRFYPDDEIWVRDYNPHPATFTKINIDQAKQLIKFINFL